MTSIQTEKAAGEVATWRLDIASRTVTRSSNHDQFYGHAENLPYWNIEHFLNHLHRDAVEPFSAQMRGVIARCESFDFTFQVVWKDGSIHLLRSSGYVECDEHGKPKSMIGSTRFA